MLQSPRVLNLANKHLSLQRLSTKVFDMEDFFTNTSPRILKISSRLSDDLSNLPIIEMNISYI